MTKEEWERMERNKKNNPLPDTQLNRSSFNFFVI